MVKLEKLVEKLKKLEKKKDIDGMMDIVLDVKSEIKAATGSSISMGNALDQIHREMQVHGYTPPKKEWGRFTKRFSKKDKRNAHRAEYVAMVLANPDGVFNFEEEKLLYMAKHGHDKNKDQEDQEKQGIEIPASMALDVTTALCGLFACSSSKNLGS